MDILGGVSVGSIIVICFLVAEAAKACGIDSKWCPIIVGVSGGILGIVGWKVMTDFPANDILTAIAVGISSGLAATGVHQINKQLGKKNA